MGNDLSIALKEIDRIIDFNRMMNPDRIFDQRRTTQILKTIRKGAIEVPVKNRSQDYRRPLELSFHFDHAIRPVNLTKLMPEKSYFILYTSLQLESTAARRGQVCSRN